MDLGTPGGFRETLAPPAPHSPGRGSGDIWVPVGTLGDQPGPFATPFSVQCLPPTPPNWGAPEGPCGDLQGLWGDPSNPPARGAVGIGQRHSGR